MKSQRGKTGTLSRTNRERVFWIIVIPVQIHRGLVPVYTQTHPMDTKIHRRWRSPLRWSRGRVIVLQMPWPPEVMPGPRSTPLASPHLRTPPGSDFQLISTTSGLCPRAFWGTGRLMEWTTGSPHLRMSWPGHEPEVTSSSTPGGVLRHKEAKKSFFPSVVAQICRSGDHKCWGPLYIFPSCREQQVWMPQTHTQFLCRKWASFS